MTLQELQNEFPDATDATWHQHPNGGGWVENTAHVYAYVGPDAVVYGNAWVIGHARVCGNARVYGNTWVFGNARVCENARVFGNTMVYE